MKWIKQMHNSYLFPANRPVQIYDNIGDSWGACSLRFPNLIRLRSPKTTIVVVNWAALSSMVEAFWAALFQSNTHADAFDISRPLSFYCRPHRGLVGSFAHVKQGRLIEGDCSSGRSRCMSILPKKTQPSQETEFLYDTLWNYIILSSFRILSGRSDSVDTGSFEFTQNAPWPRHTTAVGQNLEPISPIGWLSG